MRLIISLLILLNLQINILAKTDISDINKKNWNFTFRVYKKHNNKTDLNNNSEGSIFTPFSTGQIFTYLSNGASGNTKDSIASALNSRTTLSHLSSEYSQPLITDDSLYYHINNYLIFDEKDFKNIPEFHLNNPQAYNIHYDDNTTYEEVTKYTDILKFTPPLTVISNNSINWSFGERLANDTLYLRAKYRYYSDKSAEIVELPCSNNYCLIIMGKKQQKTNSLQSLGLNKINLSKLQFWKDDLSPLTKFLNTKSWNKLINEDLEEKLGEIYIPKFTAKSTLKLNNILGNSGFALAFSPAADFRELHPSGMLKISTFYSNNSFTIKEDKSARQSHKLGQFVFQPKDKIIAILYKKDSQDILMISEVDLEKTKH